MNNKVVTEGNLASSEDSPELQAGPDASAENGNLADLNATMRPEETGFPSREPMPTGNPKLSVGS